MVKKGIDMVESALEHVRWASKHFAVLRQKHREDPASAQIEVWFRKAELELKKAKETLEEAQKRLQA